MKSNFFTFFLHQSKKLKIKFFFLPLCFYFLLVLYFALPEGLSTTLTSYGVPNPDCSIKSHDQIIGGICNPTLQITASSTAKDYLKFFNGGDPGYYVAGGLTLAGNDLSNSYQQKNADLSTQKMLKSIRSLPLIKRLKMMRLLGFGTWPPGMYILNALPLIFSTEIPLGLYQVIVAAILWSIAFALIASLFVCRLRAWIALTLPALLMFFPLFQDYFIRYGVMYSETYGTAFMIIGFTLLACFFYCSPNKILMLIAGICFAIASLFRSQMFPVASGVSFILVADYLSGILPFKPWDKTFDRLLKLAAIIFLLSFYLPSIIIASRSLFYGAISIALVINYLKKDWPLKAGVKTPIYNLELATILFLLGLYLPIGNYMALNNGALFHTEFVWQYPFTTPAYPHAAERNFLALGGMRAACEADIKKCESIQNRLKLSNRIHHAQHEVFKSFINHPIKFSQYKLPIAWRFWMEDSSNSESFIYRWDSIFILALFFFCLAFMVVKRLWLFLSFSISTVALVFGPPFLLHFEVRYFYIIKAYILFLPLWLLFIQTQPKSILKKQ